MRRGRYIVCADFWSRFLGAARPCVRPGDTLVFPSSKAVHTLFGRLPARILFLAPDGTVLHRVDQPKRGRVYFCLKAEQIQEAL
jgi:hypothetical protein